MGEEGSLSEVELLFSSSSMSRSMSSSSSSFTSATLATDHRGDSGESAEVRGDRIGPCEWCFDTRLAMW